jgi:four helix bundle protein
LPRHELFGLSSQLRRAAVSIPSNVAEGAARRTSREFLSFLHVARGSFAELETQLHLAISIGYLTDTALAPVLCRLDEVGRLLTAVIIGLRRREAQRSSLPPTP